MFLRLLKKLRDVAIMLAGVTILVRLLKSFAIMAVILTGIVGFIVFSGLTLILASKVPEPITMSEISSVGFFALMSLASIVNMVFGFQFLLALQETPAESSA